MFMMKKIQILLIGLMFSFPCNLFAQSYLYGDVNGDGEVNVSDVNAVIGVILGDYHSSTSIVGSWISEYALDDNGERFDIPAPIMVSFDFYEDHTGQWGYHPNNNTEITDYVGFTWEQQAKRLYLWFDDGDHEELYYGFNEEGYLLLSLNAQLTQYTAYCPVHHDNLVVTTKVNKETRHSDRAVPSKSLPSMVAIKGIK